MFISLRFLFHLLVVVNEYCHSLKTMCDQLKFPIECRCYRSRRSSFFFYFNETRLRCRSLTELTPDDQWSSVPYDRLTFDTPQDQLQIHRLTFSNLIARSLRFSVAHLILNDQTLSNAYLGQLIFTNQDTYGTIEFEDRGAIFYGTTITKLHFKSINFQKKISESIFSKTRIYALWIESSAFFGFIPEQIELSTKNILMADHDNFLDYDSISVNRTKDVSRRNDDVSSIESSEIVTMNITFLKLPTIVHIYTIIASINTSNLTESYFLRYVDYNQTEEIQLSQNRIRFLNAHTFQYLRTFRGRLLLNDNQIESIHPDALFGLIHLTNLSLANNFLRTLSSIHFRSLEQLIELDLSFNRLTALDSILFQHLQNLQILYLNMNPLVSIHPQTFQWFNRLKEIHLYGVDLIHSNHFEWIWPLADLSIRLPSISNESYDLADVTSCLRLHQNQNHFSFISSSYSCSSCPTYYFFRDNHSMHNYLRLTPHCSFIQSSNNDLLLLRNLDHACDYTTHFYDCPSVTMRTTTMDLLVSTNDSDEMNSTRIHLTPTEKNIFPRDPKSIHQLIKMFVIIAIITTIIILLLVLWYRFKVIIQRKQKKKILFEQQRYFHSLNNTNNYATTLNSNSSPFFNNSKLNPVSQGLIGSANLSSKINSRLVTKVTSFIDGDDDDDDDDEIKKTTSRIRPSSFSDDSIDLQDIRDVSTRY